MTTIEEVGAHESGNTRRLYAAQVPAALLFVPVAIGVARIKSESPRHVLLWACSGALAFDGLVLGFWPSLYGHDGVARAVVATLLLWAFAWIVAAGLLVAPGEARAAESQAAAVRP